MESAQCKPLPAGRKVHQAPVSATMCKVNIWQSSDPGKPLSPESGPTQRGWSFPVIFCFFHYLVFKNLRPCATFLPSLGISWSRLAFCLGRVHVSAFVEQTISDYWKRRRSQDTVEGSLVRMSFSCNAYHALHCSAVRASGWDICQLGAALKKQEQEYPVYPLACPHWPLPWPSFGHGACLVGSTYCKMLTCCVLRSTRPWTPGLSHTARKWPRTFWAHILIAWSLPHILQSDYLHSLGQTLHLLKYLI